MENSLFDLKGRIALITGSSRGLGFAIARGLARAGAIVVLNARHQDKLASAVSVLTGQGLAAHGFVFDVLQREQIEKQVREIETSIGPIDILVNNVGNNLRGALEDFEEAAWHEVIDINLTSAWLVSKVVVREMISRCSGKIINTCSLMSELGRNTTGPYTAAKGGLKMLTRAMAVEWAGHNIQVNGIGPGYFITELTQPLADNPEFDNWLKKRTPAGRWGNVDELAGTAIFLASAASSFVSGQIIYVDGGVLAAL